jgi:hypothetical protein
LTEANNPYYWFNMQPWVVHASDLLGTTSPDGNIEKWFISMQCPLNHEVNPRVGGWLAKVLQESEIKLKDNAEMVVEDDQASDEEKKSDEGNGNAPVSSRQKL